MAESVIEIKSRITIHVDVTCIIDDSVILCDAIIETAKTVPTNFNG